MNEEQLTKLLSYKPAPDVLADRVILVTGAGSGLGRAIARACAAHGATVILLGRTVKKLELTYDAITDAGDPEPAIFPMDLAGAQWGDFEKLAQAIDKEFGRLDGLVHNAALFDSLRPMAEVKPPDWLNTIQVNLNAPYFMTQLCLPLLGKSADASVVFVADHVGPAAQAFWGPYAVAKAGLSSLASIWEKELKNSNVRVSQFDPGPVKTRLRELAYPAEPVDVAQAPEDVTKAFLYLLGPDSREM